MADDWHNDRAEPVAVGPPRRRMTRQQRAREARHRRRRRTAAVAAVAMLVVVVIGAVFLGSRMWHSMFGGSGNDFTGEGVNDVVIQIHDGDSTTAIGKTLQERQGRRHHQGVRRRRRRQRRRSRRSSPASTRCAPRSRRPTRWRGWPIPSNRVGKLVIPEGRQLDDISDVKTNAVTDGIFTLISEATCVDLDGDRRCVPGRGPARGRRRSSLPRRWRCRTGRSSPVDRAGRRPPPDRGSDRAGHLEHRSVGAAAGHPVDADRRGSASSTSRAGCWTPPSSLNMSPYEILMVASLVQREAKPQDFAKVARVIYNRLAEHRTLEFDSTVNYPLDRSEVATTDADRAQDTPWNTYVRQGLPATPICSPGAAALARRRAPRAGGLAVLRHHRHAGHDAVHPRLPAAPGEHRAGASATVSSTARRDERRSTGRRCWARRSRTPGPRSCTWPPTARSAWTTGPTTASSAPPSNCRPWSAVSGRSGSGCR